MNKTIVRVTLKLICQIIKQILSIFNEYRAESNTYTVNTYCSHLHNTVNKNNYQTLDDIY